VRRVSLETLIESQLTSMTFGTWYLVVAYRGNGGIHIGSRFSHMSSARSASDGGGPVTRKEFRTGRSQGNLARTTDVAVVISLKLVYTPVDDRYHAPMQH